ncbi:hypothetical protein CJD92_22350 [Salmonella enterica subsp. enterica serovar Newport]|nr:hypothetical protein [Salmonella enterica subsp. enterica serovar Newport]
MNLEKLMIKHQNARMTKAHFKAAESMINHIQSFLDGQKANVERTYRNKMRDLRNDGKMPESTKQALIDKAEIDLLAASEILSILKMNNDEAENTIKQIKDIHLNKEGY